VADAPKAPAPVKKAEKTPKKVDKQIQIDTVMQDVINEAKT
jgi:hypothetical protein